MKQVRKRFIRKAALLVALPIEFLNFWVVGYPAGSEGLSSSSRSAAFALEWYLLHLPAVIISDRSRFLRTHTATCSVMLWIVGYLDTALLVAAILWIGWITRLALRRPRGLSSP